MSLHRRFRHGRNVLVGTALGIALLTAEAASAQSVPQTVANPYYTATATVTQPSVIYPMTTYPGVANGSAANAAATLAEAHVVYPAAMPDVSLATVRAVTPSVAKVNGLPRDRVAALRAAVQVTTLDSAYRAGVAAYDVLPSMQVAEERTHTNSLRSGMNEPSHFAPAANATRLPSSNGLAEAASGYRRDIAVQPVSWLTDAAKSANKPATNGEPQDTAPNMTAPSNSSQLGAAPDANPLRREPTRRQAMPMTRDAGGPADGNPLR